MNAQTIRGHYIGEVGKLGEERKNSSERWKNYFFGPLLRLDEGKGG